MKFQSLYAIIFVLLMNSVLYPEDKKTNPAFEVDYIGINLIELIIYSPNYTSEFSINICTLPDIKNQVNYIYTQKLELKENDTIVNIIPIHNYNIIDNAGRLLVRYKDDTSSTSTDTIVVLRDLNTFFTDAGVLFAYGKDGLIKGYPTFSIAAYSKQTTSGSPGKYASK